MNDSFYPDCIKTLPEADLPIADVTGYLLAGDHGQVCFFDFPNDTVVPAHAHGEQWGVVVHGEMRLTIGDETKVYRQGDSYFIPSGVMHSAEIKASCKVLDFFKDADRYTPK